MRIAAALVTAKRCNKFVILHNKGLLSHTSPRPSHSANAEPARHPRRRLRTPPSRSPDQVTIIRLEDGEERALPPLLLINPASTVTVRRDGQWQTIGPLKALVADVGDLNIVHRTVFSRPKESVNAPQVSLCAHQTEGQTNPTVCDRRVLREEGTQRRVGRQRRYTDHIVSSRRMGTDASSNVGGVISAKRGTCSQRLSSTGHGYG